MIVLVRDRAALVAALRKRGVDYLAPSDAQGGPPMDDGTLIASLAAHPDARLRQALIALFLLQPHLASYVPRLRGQLDPRAAQELVAYYMAAVYLQNMWRTRLGHYLKPFPELPDYFSAELGLPKANDLYGKAGLYALAGWHAQRSPYRFNHRSAYEGVADLLFQSLKLKRRPYMFVERFGTLDVLHFDLYSTALSKIERGREQDLADVLSLLRAGRLEWDRLVGYFQEILPRMGAHSLKQDPIEFEQNFRALEALWQAQPDASTE